MDSKTSRRKFLQLMASTAAAGFLGSCGSPPQQGAATQSDAPAEQPAAVAEPTAAPTAIVLGQGDTEISIWVQDFGPMINHFQNAAADYSKQAGNIKVSLQSSPDLQAKTIPAVSAGNEPEIMMGYTNWYVATDISKLFLQLDDVFGGRAALEQTVFPAAMRALSTPEDKVFYLPYLTGLNGATTTVNMGAYGEKNLDYKSFTSFEEFAAAAKELTVREGDSIQRAGLSIWAHALTVIKSWIWQLGGEFYDGESGKWTLSTPEGESALQRIQDIYQKDKVCSLDIASIEYESFLKGSLVTQMLGAWTLGVAADSNPELKLDLVPTPKLLDATTDVVYPDHTAVITLSRRLAQDSTKLEATTGIAKSLMSADALISITESYSGSLMSTALYADPRIEKTKYGPVSKRISENIWPRARFPQDHVANQEPALTELQRALTKEISVKDALTNADTYLNEQETQARERIAS